MRVESLLLGLSLASICLAFAHAHGHHLAQSDDDPDKVRCGTEDLDVDAMKRIKEITIKKKARVVQPRASIVTIDTYCVVLTDDFGSPDVLDSDFTNQIDVLNEQFASSGSVFRFQKAGETTRLTLSNASTADFSEYADEITLNYRRGGMDALNLFVVPNIHVDSKSTVLGRTKNFFATGVATLDGVFLIRRVLPYGGFKYSDNGVTAVHEVGHWLGLVHPFQASPGYSNDPCNVKNLNDYIDDTATMFNETSKCPADRDSCPNLPGNDPVDNFMDYGYLYYPTRSSPCKTSFTEQQVARMEDVWYFYRVGNEFCGIGELQFELELKFDDHPENLVWQILTSDGNTVIHDSRPDVFGLSFDAKFAGKTININRCLPDDSYLFGIYNLKKLGIAAPGYYAISVNGQLVAKGGQDFTSSKRIPFSSSAISTLSPTVKPTRQPTARPTFKPSIAPATPTKPTAPTAGIPVNIPTKFCFSKGNTVEVEGKGVIAMKDLQIGDWVTSIDGKMAQVYSFGHYQHNVKADYLQIHTQGLAKPLEISKDHLVFVNGTAIPASRVSVGDMINLGSGLGVAKVAKIKTVVRSGAYAPFTTSGTIIVSDVAASSYVTLQENSSFLVIGPYQFSLLSMHWLAHMFQTPHRLACKYQLTNCTTETYSDDGVSMWVEGPWHVCQWLLRQSGMVMASLFFPALIFMVLLHGFEEALTNIRMTIIATIGCCGVAAFAVLYRRNAAGKAKGKTMVV